MKQIRMSWLVLLAALLVMPAFARGNNETTSVMDGKELRGFTRVVAGYGIAVDIKQSKTFTVKATGDAEAIENLDLRVRGETLRIAYKRGMWGKSVIVSITMPALEAVSLSGGSVMTIDFDATKTRNFKLELSGGARMEGVFLATGLVADVSGGSRVSIEGYGNDFIGKLSGGSRFDCQDWAVDKAVMDLSGGAFAVLAVQTALTAEVSGGSRVEYRGNPKLIKKASGGGSVSALK